MSIPEMVEWCQANLTGIDFYHNELSPPLDFAEDNSFDLMLASSVFTHIPLETQELWLAEMQRVLASRRNIHLLCFRSISRFRIIERAGD